MEDFKDVGGKEVHSISQVQGPILIVKGIG